LFRDRNNKYIAPPNAVKTKRSKNAGNCSSKYLSSFAPNHAANPIDINSWSPRPLYFKNELEGCFSFTAILKKLVGAQGTPETDSLLM
jgi:hypothetical protein